MGLEVLVVLVGNNSLYPMPVWWVVHQRLGGPACAVGERVRPDARAAACGPVMCPGIVGRFLLLKGMSVLELLETEGVKL